MLVVVAWVIQIIRRIYRKGMGSVLKPVFGYHMVWIFFTFEYGNYS